MALLFSMINLKSVILQSICSGRLAGRLRVKEPNEPKKVLHKFIRPPIIKAKGHKYFRNLSKNKKLYSHSLNPFSKNTHNILIKQT